MKVNIFERELAGETISPSDPDFPLIHEVIHHAFELTSKLNRLVMVMQGQRKFCTNCLEKN